MLSARRLLPFCEGRSLGETLRRRGAGVEMIDISEHASQKTYKLRKSAQLKLILMMAGNRRIKEGRLNPFQRHCGEFIKT